MISNISSIEGLACSARITAISPIMIPSCLHSEHVSRMHLYVQRLLLLRYYLAAAVVAAESKWRPHAALPAPELLRCAVSWLPDAGAALPAQINSHPKLEILANVREQSKFVQPIFPGANFIWCSIGRYLRSHNGVAFKKPFSNTLT